MSWLRRWIGVGDGDKSWTELARASILDVNDGIASAAGVVEGFAAAGASTRTTVFAGAAVILGRGFASAGGRYAEERTDWEINQKLLEEERASIEADPEAELEELVGLYEAKGLPAQLAREVAETLTANDPVAAHADAELRLDTVGSLRTSVLAGVIAGLFYGLGAAIPLVLIAGLPVDVRIEITFAAVLVALGLTGWLASRLTDLPALEFVRRNLGLGTATMAVGLLVGAVISV